jgi:hypothetical protein
MGLIVARLAASEGRRGDVLSVTYRVIAYIKRREPTYQPAG